MAQPQHTLIRPAPRRLLMLAEQFDAFLIDLDGVVYVGPDVLPGAAAAVRRLRQLGRHVRFVTNDPRPTRAQVPDRLTGLASMRRWRSPLRRGGDGHLVSALPHFGRAARHGAARGLPGMEPVCTPERRRSRGPLGGVVCLPRRCADVSGQLPRDAGVLRGLLGRDPGSRRVPAGAPHSSRTSSPAATR